MSPTQTPYLRDVGPQTDIDEAGQLVKELGAHNKGEALRLQVARAHPPEVQRAQARAEDVFRTRFVQREEVESVFADAFDKQTTIIPEDTREAEDLDDNAAEVLGWSVVGKGADPEAMQVVVSYRVKSGRTAKAVVPYAHLKDSAKAYDKALDAEAFNPFLDEADRDFRRELSNAEQAAIKAARGTGATVQAPLGAIEGFNQTAATPEEVLAERAAAGEVDPAELASKNVKDIQKVVPDLDEAQLDALESAEQDGKKRKTVFEAINEQRDARANE